MQCALYSKAKAESFMKTLKVDAVYPMAYETFEDEVVTHVLGTFCYLCLRVGH